METPRQRTRLQLPWQIGVAFVLTVVSLAGLLATWQYLASRQEEKQLRPVASWAHVDHVSLFYHCMGAGRPTVILAAAFSATADEWSWMMPAIARVTRVCAYDRAGLGWSEESHQPHDALHVAQQLDALLVMARIPGPYLLVGHSMGGLFVREYAGLYPHKVAGLVAIDPVAPGELERLPRQAAAGYYRLYRFTAVAPLLARLGLLRFWNPFLAQAAGLPPRQVAIFRHFFNSPRHLAAMHAELRQWYVTGQEVGQSPLPDDLPLIVIGAGMTEQGNPEVAAVQAQMQRELAGRSHQGHYLRIPGGRHATLVTQAAQASVTSRIIIGLVQRVRVGPPGRRVTGKTGESCGLCRHPGGNPCKKRQNAIY